MRKLITFDDDTLGRLTQLGRDRGTTMQQLADEAFADLLQKHGVPTDLDDALRRSVNEVGQSTSDRKTTRRRNNTPATRKRPHAKRAAKRSVHRG
ncbi:hypothetical protein RPMA_18805 [Tardiphaga alba]|uniref:Ribbon-helix-helix CopG family protein n=1 Tax=Tardiphaga alba TaxID=340268 RepID=A0ABX8AFE1_9BRAD|nr:hypothetical protein RPMA_18805 [Tardiphaga alba]